MSVNYANEIKNARISQGLTQKDLAKKLGYSSASVVSNAEHGKVTGKKLEDILDVLGVPYRHSYTIYTDGGCEYNPGGRGGYGCVIINDITGELRELSGGFISTTNNRMEIFAVIAALKDISKGSEVELFSDSQYVIKTIEGYYEIKKNKDLWSMLEKCLKGLRIKTRWIRGHQGDRYNERCDELATEGYLGAYMEDKGYVPEHGEKNDGHLHPAKISSMSVTIDIPEEDAPVIDDPAAYAGEKNITRECAENIRRFYEKERHGFGDYKNLRTYGKDSWSSLGIYELRKKFKRDYGRIVEYIHGEKSIASALRWRGRGLTLYDAIRKVLVDEEVNENVIKSKRTRS